VTAGIFALVGVVIGALLSTVLAFATERSRDSRLAFVLARVVQDDLTFIDAVMGAEVSDGTWDRLTPEGRPLAFEVWPEARSVLAGHLSFEDWGRLCVAARQVGIVSERMHVNPKLGKAISANEAAQIQSVRSDIQRGIDVLQPLSHGHRLPRLLARRPRPGSS
jgi:hypothetical protein